MQTPKTRSGSADLPHRTYPVATRPSRPSKAHTSSSTSDSPSTKSPAGRSQIERRSPINSEQAQKKRPAKLTELETQLSQLQDELKKTKDQVINSELFKKRAQQEAEEAKRQLLAMSTKLKDSQCQLSQQSSAEDARLIELRKLSQERDRAWQSEVEAMQKQHASDSTALASAMNEVHRLRMQLAARTERSEAEQEELHQLKQEMVEALTSIDELRAKLKQSEESEAESKAMLDEAKQQLEASRVTIDSLLNDGSALMDSFSLVVSELEEKRARVKLLEEMVENLEKDNFSDRDNVMSCTALELEVQELRSELEAAEAKFQEEQILSTVHTQYAYELLEQIKLERDIRQSKFVAALESTKSEVIFLKANLFDKDMEIRKALDINKQLQADVEKERINRVEYDMSQSNATEVTELKDKLYDTELLLQRALDENQQLKLELVKYEMEDTKAVAERLRAAETAKEEMEMELRKLRVQAEQWRKAAETAIALTTVGKDSDHNYSYINSNAKVKQRSESLDPSKFVSLPPFPEEFDEESPGRRNSNVLSRISGMWKK